MSLQGRSVGAGPSRSHRSTTAGEVAVGGHRWSRPVERKVMTGGAALSVRAGEGAGERALSSRAVGPRVQLGQARDSTSALSGHAAGPSRGRREAVRGTGFSFSYF
jgi:hypothetical protein